MNIMRTLSTAALTALVAATPVFGGNPCTGAYQDTAGEILTSPGGRVARIEPVEWFEDGVYRITVKSGGVIMTRPDGLPMPPVGADLELRVYSKSKSALPFAGCYCQVGTNVCVEEYSYP